MASGSGRVECVCNCSEFSAYSLTSADNLCPPRLFKQLPSHNRHRKPNKTNLSRDICVYLLVVLPVFCVYMLIQKLGHAV